MPRVLKTLTLSDAKQMLSAGEAKAQSIGIPYNPRWLMPEAR